MKKLYFVFDQLPDKGDGGLIATYINLYYLLKEKYDIHVISVFNFEKNTTPFSDSKIHVVNNHVIDNRFYKMFSYISKLDFKKFGKAFCSLFTYFFTIKTNRKKIKKIINNDDYVVVSCPSAGIFMPSDIDFITEIHTSYNYFFGNNILGKMQAKLMTTPKLTLFRTKYDAEHAPKYLNPSYIYNFFDNSNIVRSKNIVKNKLCFVGRIEDVKDPLRLIDIAKKLFEKNKNFELDIYGDGSLSQQCKDKINELNLSKIVHMKGYTNNKNIYANYSASLLTSKFEGLPMSIIESKANGIPTITTRFGDSVLEMISNNKDGFVCESDDEFVEKTNELLTDDKLLTKMSENAYKSFNHFSKERAYKNWIKILENYK